MQTLVISDPEETVTVTNQEDVKVENVVSFQNQSNYPLFWSSEPITDTNKGGVLPPTPSGAERVLSDNKTVYFKVFGSDCNIQCRSVAL